MESSICLGKNRKANKIDNTIFGVFDVTKRERNKFSHYTLDVFKKMYIYV